MPTLAKVLTADDLRAGARQTHIDLSEYYELIDAVCRQAGHGGIITLGDGESQRTEKRRLSIAAKERGLKLTWRKSAPGELRFVLSDPASRPPDGRRRRGPADGQQAQRRGRGRRSG